MKKKRTRPRFYTHDQPPKPAPNMSSLNGWLSPDGKYYACEHNGHIFLAGQMGHTEQALERMGWAKISDALQGDPGVPRRQTSVAFFKPPTQKQRDRVWDWCQKHGRDYEREIPRD